MEFQSIFENLSPYSQYCHITLPLPSYIFYAQKFSLSNSITDLQLSVTNKRMCAYWPEPLRHLKIGSMHACADPDRGDR